MEHTARHRCAAMVVATLLLAGALVVLPAPDASADFVFVPVVFVKNNTLSLDLTVYGGYVRANVTREFILNETHLLDELFEAGTVAPGAVSLSARCEEPPGAALNTSSEGFKITFNTTSDGMANLSVRYSYSVQFASVGSLNFSFTPESIDRINPMWEALFMSILDLTLRVHSNVPVSVYNGTAYHNGTDVNVSYLMDRTHSYDGRIWNDPPCLVSWTEGPQARVNETLFSRLVPEHRPMMEDLIRSEYVNITIGKGAGVMPYRLDGRFILNKTLLAPYDSVWLWFPNNITCATGKVNGDPCGIEPSVRNGQPGFYILARFSYWSGNLTFDINITGNLTDPWCDFFIVTVPVEHSSVRYILPPTAKVTAYGSPFENAVFQNTSESSTLDFSGKCAGRGPVHIGWDWQTSPGCWVEASASGVNTSSARLLWSTSGNPDFKEYRICMSDRPGSLGQVVGRVTSQTATSFLVRNLWHNSTYYFTVRKVLGGNVTVDSNTVEVRTEAFPLPAPKLTVHYTGDEASIPVLRWTRCDHPDFGHYLLFRSGQQGSRGDGVFNTNDSSVPEHIPAGLAWNSTYYFTLVIDLGSYGWVESEQVKVFVPPEPPKHFLLKAWRRSDDPGTVHLRWNASESGNFSHYEVYMSTGPGPLGTRLTNITQRSLVEYTIGELPAGQDCYFTVRAVTNLSGSTDSYQVRATILQADPADEDPARMWSPWVALGLGVIAMAGIVVVLALTRARRRKQ